MQKEFDQISNESKIFRVAMDEFTRAEISKFLLMVWDSNSGVYDDMLIRWEKT